MIQCKKCGRKPNDDNGKVVLVRTNKKGIPGKFVCAPGTGCRKNSFPGVKSQYAFH